MTYAVVFMNEFLLNKKNIVYCCRSGLENIPEPWQLNIEQAAPAPDEELLRRKSKIRYCNIGNTNS